jgi:predicted thioesterase
VLLHADGQRIKGTTADLSAGGMLVTCAHILIPGTKLKGEVYLSEDEALPFEAQVRWSRNSTRWLATEIQHSMGLEFTRSPGAVYLGYLEVSAKSSITVEAVRANTKPPPMRTQTSAGQPETRGGTAVESPRSIEIIRTRSSPIVTPPPMARDGTVHTPPPSSRVMTPAPPASPRVMTPAPPVRQTTPVPPPPAPNIPPPEEHTGTGLVVDEPFPNVNAGLTGVARGNASSSQKRESGSSPLAPSTVAALIERAAAKAVGEQLPAGFRTVGLALDIELRKPPLVKLGSVLEARATLVRLQPDRTLVFSCEVRQEDQLIASGQHLRLIMELDGD